MSEGGEVSAPTRGSNARWLSVVVPGFVVVFGGCDVVTVGFTVVFIVGLIIIVGLAVVITGFAEVITTLAVVTAAAFGAALILTVVIGFEIS